MVLKISDTSYGTCVARHEAAGTLRTSEARRQLHALYTKKLNEQNNNNNNINNNYSNNNVKDIYIYIHYQNRSLWCVCFKHKMLTITKPAQRNL